MLKILKELEQYTANATDGEVGKVANFLLDDERWAVRYLVIETGTFFDRRPVLISPIAARRIDEPTKSVHLALTRTKVKGAPSVDVDLPVSRRHERDFNLFYGYPYYWGMRGTWGMAPSPALMASAAAVSNEEPSEPDGDVHLRSAKEIRGYHVQGTDEAIGHIEDFIVDEETWVIRYLIVDTKNWWFGKKVLIAPHWASGVRWAEHMVDVGLTRDAIKNSPEWNGLEAINRDYEARLHDHYRRRPYWDTSPNGVQGELSTVAPRGPRPAPDVPRR